MPVEIVREPVVHRLVDRVAVDRHRDRLAQHEVLVATDARIVGG